WQATCRCRAWRSWRRTRAGLARARLPRPGATDGSAAERDGYRRPTARRGCAWRWWSSAKYRPAEAVDIALRAALASPPRGSGGGEAPATAVDHSTSSDTTENGMSPLVRFRLVALPAVLLLPASAPAADWRDVTLDRLLKADDDGANWLMYNRTYSGWRYSPLDQVNAGNVKKLVPKFIFAGGTVGDQQ